MLGIILCGGKSERMGTDKGLLVRDGRFWAEIAEEKLLGLNISTAFSINSEQEQLYSHYLGGTNLIVDHPRLDVGGPLLGVLSAHMRNPNEDLFLITCDLILMEIRLLDHILKSYQTDGSFDAYMYTKDGQHEPLCGIYKAVGLKNIMNMLERSALEKHSMKYVLSKCRVYNISLENKDFGCFTNFNSQLDIQGYNNFNAT